MAVVMRRKETVDSTVCSVFECVCSVVFTIIIRLCVCMCWLIC